MALSELLSEHRILPVVKITDAGAAAPLAEALVRGGLSAVEITFRSGAAEDAIRETCRRAPEMRVFAGTILSVEDAARAFRAGAAAAVSPGFVPEVVRWCLKEGAPVIPGCATPTDVAACLALGLGVVKLFPAELLGGPAMLKALGGPFPSMRFMPTGGITPDNVAAYLALGNVAACGGTWIAPEALIVSGNFDEISRRADSGGGRRVRARELAGEVGTDDETIRRAGLWRSDGPPLSRRRRTPRHGRSP